MIKTNMRTMKTKEEKERHTLHIMVTFQTQKIITNFRVFSITMESVGIQRPVRSAILRQTSALW